MGGLFAERIVRLTNKANQQTTTKAHRVKTHCSTIELLESRIAPASVIHMTDANGDVITFTSSLGNLAGMVTSSGVLADMNHDQFTVDLSSPIFNSTNFTVSVAKAPHADGQLANLIINAGSNNLGKVSIGGDLGTITAGSGSATVPAIKSLSVNSIGRFEGEEGGIAEISYIAGSVGKVAVKGNVDGSFLNVSQDIGSVSIGGSLIGGTSGFEDDGDIFAMGNIGSVSIKHDVDGGAGEYGGIVAAYVDLGPVTIGGSVYGGSGEFSATIGGGTNTSSVTIGGSLVGGTGEYSGEIYAGFNTNGTLGKVTLGGSLVGGGGEGSGFIGYSEGGGGFNVSITSVVIGGNIVAGGGEFTGDVYSYGGAIGSVALKGSLFGGTNSNAANSGLIAANTNQQSGVISIGGSVYGGQVGFPGGSVEKISIRGSIYGGNEDASGLVSCLGTIGMLDIGGDVIGGSGNGSGSVTAGAITTETIGGVLIPGTGMGSGTVTP
jgi:hypothetical protein